MGHGQSVVVRDPATGLGANVNASGKLEVDTEISMSGDFNIENVTVGKTDAGALKYLRVGSSRNLYVINPPPIQKTGNWAAAQTDTALWTPVAGKKIHLHGVMVSTEAGNEIQLESADVDVVPPMYLSASGGAVISGMGEIWMGAADATLTVTSTVATNHSVLLWGYEE